MKPNKFTTLTSAALLAFSANSSAITIDLFETYQAKLTDKTLEDGNTDYKDGSALYSSVNTGGDDILGSNRDLGINLLSTSDLGEPDPDPSNIDGNGDFIDPTLIDGDYASVRVSGGKLTFSADASAKAQGIVQWDGAENTLDVDIDGLNGIDLTEGGINTSFQLETFFSDLGFEFTIQIWDMTGASVTAFLASSKVDSATPVTSFLGLNTWGNCNAAGTGGVLCLDGLGNFVTTGVDLTDVGAIEFVIDPFGNDTSIDLKLGSITAVPEPSTIALLGLGLFAAGFTARKKQA